MGEHGCGYLNVRYMYHITPSYFEDRQLAKSHSLTSSNMHIESSTHYITDSLRLEMNREDTCI
jgi:hypothetical protein